MASNPAPDEIYVDPSISVPDGIRSVKRPSLVPGDNDTFATGPNTEAVEVGGTGTTYYTDVVIDEIDDTPSVDIVAAPSYMTVVSQTPRVVNGQVVIDVVVEVPDVPGAVSYEVRYTKA